MVGTNFEFEEGNVPQRVWKILPILLELSLVRSAGGACLPPLRLFSHANDAPSGVSSLIEVGLGLPSRLIGVPLHFPRVDLTPISYGT